MVSSYPCMPQPACIPVRTRTWRPCFRGSTLLPVSTLDRRHGHSLHPVSSELTAGLLKSLFDLQLRSGVHRGLSDASHPTVLHRRTSSHVQPVRLLVSLVATDS